ncbi:MAG: hypothetical protein Sapg2KO_10450 [Saprospiraceae bacterium]
MKKYTILFCLMLSFIASPILGQQTLDLGKNNYNDKQSIVYLQENTFEMKLHTNGASIGLNFGTIDTYYKTRFWHFSLGELKHFRETRQSRSLQGNGFGGGNFRSYIFGKQNNFFVLRGGYGEKIYFSEKAKTKGVAVGFSYEGGPSIGILKPYYLVLRYVPENFGQLNYQSERYSEDNAQRFLTNENIFGADNFTRGLTEVKFRPGLHAKGALHFDWGAFDEFVKAVEIGMMADVYFKKVPILIESPRTPGIENQSFFLNLFVNVQFGKRK